MRDLAPCPPFQRGGSAPQHAPLPDAAAPAWWAFLRPDEREMLAGLPDFPAAEQRPDPPQAAP